eukprot:12872656-Heterocapsa_arctica.AAC.1
MGPGGLQQGRQRGDPQATPQCEDQARPRGDYRDHRLRSARILQAAGCDPHVRRRRGAPGPIIEFQ